MEKLMRLRPGRRKWAVIAGLFAAMAALFLVIASSVPVRPEPDQTRSLSFIMALFFAGCTAVSTWLSLSGASYLLLTPIGFTIRTPLMKKTVPWEDVERFEAAARMVTYTWSTSRIIHARSIRWYWPTHRITNGQQILPDTYGMQAHALADLLNDWKMRNSVTRLGIAN